MSKKKKSKNVNNLNDLLEEYFPEEKTATAEEKTSADKEKTAAAEEKATAADGKTEAVAEKTEEVVVSEEEISADSEETEDVEVVTEKIEEDPSEAKEADISVAGESEWEIAEISEIVSETGETFDGDRKDEDKDTEEENESSEEPSKGEEIKNGNDGNDTEMNEGNDSDESEMKEGNSETECISGNDEANPKFPISFLKALFPWKGDSVWEIIRKIIFIAAVIVFIGAGIMLISTLIQSRQALKDKDTVESVITTTVATEIDKDGNVVTIPPTEEENADHRANVAEYFKGINEDYVGCLELEGCDIFEPVMQGEDNEYYLTHNYYKDTNKAGALFMDYRCTFSDEYVSPNIVIYGHNQEDGTMFGNLKKYKQNVDFYAQNPVIKLSSESETGEYLIYGFFVTNALENQDSNGVVFHYHDYIETLGDEKTFDWYMGMVQERNQIVSPVDVRFGDKLLCLSTCSNEFSNSRFVIFARKLRDGESAEDYDFSQTYLNPYARGVDWEAIMSGETTTSVSEEETEETEESEETEETVVTEDPMKALIEMLKKKTETAASEEETEETASETETVSSEETADTSETSETSESETETETTTTNYRGYTGPTGTLHSETGGAASVGSSGQESGSAQSEQTAETAPPESAAPEAETAVPTDPETGT